MSKATPTDRLPGWEHEAGSDFMMSEAVLKKIREEIEKEKKEKEDASRGS